MWECLQVNLTWPKEKLMWPKNLTWICFPTGSMSYSAVVSQKTTLWLWGAWVKTWVSKSESVCRWTWPDLKRSWSDLETWLNSIFTGTLTSGIVAQKTTLWFCEAWVETWLSKSESVWKVSLTWTTHKMMSHCAQKFLGVSHEAGSSTSIYLKCYWRNAVNISTQIQGPILSVVC